MSIVPAANIMSAAVSGESSADPATQRNTNTPFSMSWQRELAAAIRSPAVLRERLGLAKAATSSATRNAFPLLVPESFLQRMQPGNESDPLLLQVLPTPDEEVSNPNFVSDPVGDEQARKAPGLLQKYDGRALLIAAGACAVHCRYCFRRDYPYQNEPRRIDDWQPAIAALTADKSISEVILSGGDPLMLTDTRLRQLCEQLDAVPHIERIRFHTRLPIVLPSRITSEFLQLVKSIRAQAVVVVHANHGNEITGDCEDSLRQIVAAGLPVLNQAVLLRNVNDNVDALDLLCRRLVNIGVMPYYLHQLDRVNGAAHFEVEASLGVALLKQLATQLPGYAVPKFVHEIPGEPSKTPIINV